MKIGYTRTSTIDQNLDRQKQIMKDNNIELLFSEQESGKDTNRPILNEILKEIHINNNTTFSSPDISGEFFIDYISNFDREIFAVVGMNVKNKPTYCETCN